MGCIRLPGTGVAVASQTEAAGGFWAIKGNGFTQPYPLHIHSRLTIAVIDHGTFTLRTPQGLFVAQEGDVIVLPSDMVHAEEWTNGAFRAVYLSDQNLRVAATAAQQGDTGEPWFESPIVNCPRLVHQIGQLHDAMQSGAPASIVENKLASLMTGLRSLVTIRPRPSYSASINITRDRLHAALSDQPAVDELSRLAGWSSYHLIRTFHKELGLPPLAYLAQLKIARAKEWLVTGESLATISYRLGYSDQSHFTRAFKRSALVPPGTWSRMLQKTTG